MAKNKKMAILKFFRPKSEIIEEVVGIPSESNNQMQLQYPVSKSTSELLSKSENAPIYPPSTPSYIRLYPTK